MFDDENEEEWYEYEEVHWIPENELHMHIKCSSCSCIPWYASFEEVVHNEFNGANPQDYLTKHVRIFEN